MCTSSDVYRCCHVLLYTVLTDECRCTQPSLSLTKDSLHAQLGTYIIILTLSRNYEVWVFVNVHQVKLAAIITFILHNHRHKTVHNCNVSLANGELDHHHGHVTLTMSTWPQYGHRSLVGCRLPRLCSYSSPPYVCRLIPWVVLFFEYFFCQRSWHRTTQGINLHT